jgi:hypothetical protein
MTRFDIWRMGEGYSTNIRGAGCSMRRECGIATGSVQVATNCYNCYIYGKSQHTVTVSGVLASTLTSFAEMPGLSSDLRTDFGLPLGFFVPPNTLFGPRLNLDHGRVFLGDVGGGDSFPDFLLAVVVVSDRNWLWIWLTWDPMSSADS